MISSMSTLWLTLLTAHQPWQSSTIHIRSQRGSVGSLLKTTMTWLSFPAFWVFSSLPGNERGPQPSCSRQHAMKDKTCTSLPAPGQKCTTTLFTLKRRQARPLTPKKPWECLTLRLHTRPKKLLRSKNHPDTAFLSGWCLCGQTSLEFGRRRRWTAGLLAWHWASCTGPGCDTDSIHSRSVKRKNGCISVRETGRGQH